MMRNVVFAALAMMLLFGCTAPGNATPPASSPPATGNQTNTITSAPAANTTTPTTNPAPPANTSASTTGNAAKNSEVLLLGRSVSQGWADYMGLEWDDNGTMSGTYQGYAIRRYEVESPPGIATSAAAAMDSFDSGIVFFKLCFVDFNGDAGNAAENEGYVAQVYGDAVTKRGRKLIVGNALPQVAADTYPELKASQQAYNKWLADFAASHDGIYVLDLYGMLTDSSGALRSDYAASPGDSHLSSKAYAKITPELLKLVDKAKGN